jgi:NTP pyrophosphatase (non-canonical NTP hydrolase)
MFESADRQKLNDILSKISDLVETNTAIVSGLDAMNKSIGSLCELTGQLVDAVTSEEDSSVADELAELVAAVNGLSERATEIGKAISGKIEDIALENGMSVPAPA